MDFVTLRLGIDPSTSGYQTNSVRDLDPEQVGSLVRERLAEILDDEDDAETATRLTIEPSNPAPVRRLTADEQRTLLDIVRQYHTGTAPAQHAMAWVYGLVANSAINDGSL